MTNQVKKEQLDIIISEQNIFQKPTGIENEMIVSLVDELVFVNANEIEVLESDGSFTNVWFVNGKSLVVNKRIAFFESLLSKCNFFFRVNRSFLINIEFVLKYNQKEGSLKMKNGKRIFVFEEKILALEKIIEAQKLL